MSTTFLSAVGRVMRINAIIRGDTDLPTTFSDVQHNASINLAVVAIQDELTYLIADRLIPAERKTTGSITFVTQTRTYALATDFIRFYGVPHFFNVNAMRQIYEYEGGLTQLQVDIYNYATQYGTPNWYYVEPAATDQVGFFLVPSASENGQIWTYDYQASVLVSVASDTLPFSKTEQDNMFIQMAARRFKYTFEDVGNKADIQAVLNQDQTWKTSKAALMSLIRGRDPAQFYAVNYR